MNLNRQRAVLSRRFTLLAIQLAVLGSSPAAAEVTTAAILEIEVENIVGYNTDVFDASKFATDPSLTTVVARNFVFAIAVGDIVAVNGKPARGNLVFRGQTLILNPNPTPGQAVADIVRTGVSEYLFEIQQADGTSVGNVHTLGMSGGVSPVGAPQGGGNLPIAGGAGVFLGARGQMATRGVVPPVPPRNASVTEDPARRRIHGGGRVLFLFQLIPMTRPEIVTGASGPAIFHADFSPVTAARPASAGEVVTVRATGLGPTRPGVTPGQPFPLDALQEVNSPIGVLVGGRAAEVVNKVGWPGLIDTYRVDVRLPEGTPSGLAIVELSAAWVPGHKCKFPFNRPGRKGGLEFRR